MRKLLISLAAVLSLLALCACGGAAEIMSEPEIEVPVVELSGGSFPADAEEISVILNESDIEKLGAFTKLRSADFSGSACEDAIYEWQLRHPEVDVLFTVTLPGGIQCSDSEASLDLSQLSREDALSCISALPKLSRLEALVLADEEAENGISLDEAVEFSAAAPKAVLEYGFSIYGQSLNASDSEINLSHIPVNDNGEDVEKALNIMKHCTYLDMDQSGVPDERMAEIRDAFPDVKVVWRVWFGGCYSVRTDVDTILASSSMEGDMITDDNCSGLKYCTEVTHLDIGHNGELTDISFVAYMPKLQVFIASVCYIEDLTPIANCSELEYFEIFQLYGPIKDLSPLANLKNLRHLNVCGNENITDITPLYGLTELERLWLGAYIRVPQEQIEEMQRRAPGCNINTTCWHPLDEGWRFVSLNPDVRAERYLQLYDEFHYGDGLSAYAYSFNDPLY